MKKPLETIEQLYDKLWDNTMDKLDTEFGDKVYDKFWNECDANTCTHIRYILEAELEVANGVKK